MNEVKNSGVLLDFYHNESYCNKYIIQTFFSMCSTQTQQIQAIETELEGYKRQIQKAQEQNEQLTYMANRIESDITGVKKQINVCRNKNEAIKIEYNTYNRALHETENQLGRVQTVT